MQTVSNAFPTLPAPSTYRLAIVGEQPTDQDAQINKPFSGVYGDLLSQTLIASKLSRQSCYLGNVSMLPTGKVFLTRSMWQVQEGIDTLRQELQDYQPHCVLLLGEFTSKLAGQTHPIASSRGSIFQCRDTDSPFYGFKCVATYRPNECIRNPSVLPLFRFDVARAVEESLTPDLNLPERLYELHLTPTQIIDRLRSWPLDHPAAIDIEGGVDPGITCISVAASPTSAFIIDYQDLLSSPQFSDVFDALATFLSHPRIPKILQNNFYDSLCLAWRHKTPIAPVYWDTMLSGWERYPELPKSLAVQASLYTREPYYKFERKIHDKDTHHTYCCKDSCVTYEIYERHKESMTPEQLAHFDFNMSLVPAINYMQHRGIRYDKPGADEHRAILGVKQAELQARIDVLAGTPLNVNSPKQMQTVLYTRMGYEKQYKREAGRKTTTLTTDAHALLALLRKHRSELVYSILRWRQLEGVRKQLDITLDPDLRIRTAYNPVGTETGRMACYASNTGSGFNLQTVTHELRKFFLADPDHYIGKVDLSGADGWTVAAHSSRLSDDTMMLDYLAGVKPAKAICAMYLTGDRSLASASPEHLLSVIASLDIPDWLYNAAKAVQHGSSYGMGVNTMSANILLRSWKDAGDPVLVPAAECRKLQDLFFLRYIGVKRWQNWVVQQLNNTKSLPCASGHVRTFMGRARDNSVIQAAYSHEPQANTTYATNLALHHLWHDPSNRRGNKLIIEPLHQVHDEIVVQFHKDDTFFTINRLRAYFNNPLTIADQQITIPFEGCYGNYWGDEVGTI